MNIKKFKYLKEDTKELKEYEMVVLNNDEQHENGFILSYLKEDEKEKLLAIMKAYEESLTPFMKAFRNFKKSNMKPV